MKKKSKQRKERNRPGKKREACYLRSDRVGGIVHPSLYSALLLAFEPIPINRYTHESFASTHCTTRKLITRHTEVDYLSHTDKFLATHACLLPYM